MKLGSKTTSGGARRFWVFPALVLGLFATASCGGGGGGGSSSAPVASGSDITAVMPQVGPASGRTLVTVTGLGFVDDVTGPTTVWFGGTKATDVAVLDDTTLTCMTPVGTQGALVDVSVRNSKGNGILRDAFGYLVAPEPASDLNGDGIADAVVGAPRESSSASNGGSVYVFFGSDNGAQPEAMSAAQSNSKIAGVLSDSNFGYSLTTGDLNGDGQDDLIVGCDLDDTASNDAGAVCIFYGPVNGALSSDTADVIIMGEGMVSGDRFGSAVTLGDLDDDGKTDLIVGALRADLNPGQPGEKLDAGMVYVFLGSSGLTSTTADMADLRIAGPEAGAHFGNKVLCVDTDGDDVDDLVVASVMHDPVLPPRQVNAGSVFVFNGGAGFAPATVADADVHLKGEKGGDQFGDAMTTGDVNADGQADLIVGAPLQDTLGADVGRVYVFMGGASFSSKIAWNADFIIEGQPTNNSFGDDLTMGDVNGDGMDDLVVGASKASFGASGNGRTYVFNGGADFSNSVATLADVIYTGEAVDGERFGSCAKVLDINGDFVVDIFAGSPGNDAGGPGAGRCYFFMGAQFMNDRMAHEDDLTLTGESGGNQFGSSMIDGQ